MFQRSVSAITNAAIELFRHRIALAIMTALYALLLLFLYVFVNTKEATSMQVAASIALTIGSLFLFFTLQTTSTTFAATRSGKKLIVKSILNSWKLVLFSLPVLGLGLLFFYGLNKIQSHFPVVSATPTPAYTPTGSGAPTHTLWTPVIITSARYLFLAVLTPLMLIHLWLSASNLRLGQAFKEIVRNLGRAFSAPAVLIYSVGFGVFGVLPYLLLFKSTATSHPWLEITLFGVRLTTAFFLTLLGWVVTVRALDLVKQPSHRQA